MADTAPKRTRRTTNYKNAAKKPTSGIVPKTESQRKLIDAISTSSQVVVLGFAGTGKTYVTATMAADLYTLNKIDKIVITRPMVSVGKDIGILPGDLGEKVAPWALPVLDVLQKHWGKGMLETAIKNGNVEMAPLAMMRGRSFENAFVIADECFTPETEVLTKNGFKRFDLVTTEDEVAQYSDSAISFVKPTRKVDKDYSGKMVTVSTGKFSMTATAGHTAVYTNSNTGELIKTRFDTPVKTTWRVPTSGSILSTKNFTDSEIVLACAIQADGTLETTMKSNGVPHEYWTVTLKRSEKIQRLVSALEDLKLEYSKYEVDKRGRVKFYLKGHPDIRYISKTKSKDFNLPEIINNGVAASLLQEALLWDGSIKGGLVYCSTNKHNIDVVQTLAHICGYQANFGVQYDKRTMFKKEPKPYYRLNISQRQDITLQRASQKEFDYNGRVYCVTVPSGMVVVRQNGRVFISGNCQNITTAELKMLVTRIGEGSTIVLNGDVMQSDLKGEDGLSKIAHLAKKHMLPIPIIEFGLDDIVRSDICAQWVRVFYEEKL
jgi:phosphate starvation-inducible protein PhoH